MVAELTTDVFTPQTQTEEHILTLTSEEAEALRSCLCDLPTIDIPTFSSDVATCAELAHRQVPQRLAKLLINFRRNSNAYGMLLLRNLPTDPVLPPTPQDGQPSHEKTTQVSEGLLLLLLTYLGEPIAYADEKDGAIVQDICPVAGCESRQENTGSAFLEFHTEDGFHPYKPDYVGLICLRPDHDRCARTACASIRRALPLLSSRTIALLRQPQYRIRLASSFQTGEQEFVYSQPLPVLSGDTLEPELCIDFFAMDALTPAAGAALALMRGALERVLVDHVLTAGEMLIVDNRVAAHARTAFQPRYDGSDRWLQRMFAAQDFRRSRASRPNRGHVCTPLLIEFSANGD